MPVLRFIEPCLPSPADRPPSGSNWIHDIKHDGYRLRPWISVWAVLTASVI
jgi:ATP-dependent DNA ligase